jgi:hypothetical protein
VIRLERGTITYSKVSAIASTLGARMAAAGWVEDTLPQTLFTEVSEGLANAEAARGLVWLHGGARDFEAAPLREALAFTGGRWFRLFVGAGARSVAATPTTAPPPP